MLIQIGESEIVDHTTIAKAVRMGNSTHIYWKDGRMLSQIWDEDEVVWFSIKKAAEQDKKSPQ